MNFPAINLSEEKFTAHGNFGVLYQDQLIIRKSAFQKSFEGEEYVDCSGNIYEITGWVEIKEEWKSIIWSILLFPINLLMGGLNAAWPTSLLKITKTKTEKKIELEDLRDILISRKSDYWFIKNPIQERALETKLKKSKSFKELMDNIADVIDED